MIQDKNGPSHWKYSQDFLEYIAMAAMILDHTASLIIENSIFIDYDLTRDVIKLLSDSSLKSWYFIYCAFKAIGRIVFPIYGALLVNSAKKTRNYWKYVARILIFAIISEIPFDLAFSKQIFDWRHQNVLFTFFISLIAIAVMNQFLKCIKRRTFRIFVGLLHVAVFFLVGESMCVDYGGYGILFIIIFYYIENKKMRYILSYLNLICYLLSEVYSIMAFVLIEMNNGIRKRKYKYFFYLFYPGHLMILYLISSLLQ